MDINTQHTYPYIIIICISSITSYLMQPNVLQECEPYLTLDERKPLRYDEAHLHPEPVLIAGNGTSVKNSGPQELTLRNRTDHLVQTDRLASINSSFLESLVRREKECTRKGVCISLHLASHHNPVLT